MSFSRFDIVPVELIPGVNTFVSASAAFYRTSLFAIHQLAHLPMLCLFRFLFDSIQDSIYGCFIIFGSPSSSKYISALNLWKKYSVTPGDPKHLFRYFRYSVGVWQNGSSFDRKSGDKIVYLLVLGEE